MDTGCYYVLYLLSLLFHQLFDSDEERQEQERERRRQEESDSDSDNDNDNDSTPAEAFDFFPEGKQVFCFGILFFIHYLKEKKWWVGEFFEAPVIMDCGSSWTKSGFAAQDTPSIIFPTIVGRSV